MITTKVSNGELIIDLEGELHDLRWPQGNGHAA